MPDPAESTRSRIVKKLEYLATMTKINHLCYVICVKNYHGFNFNSLSFEAAYYVRKTWILLELEFESRTEFRQRPPPIA